MITTPETPSMSTGTAVLRLVAACLAHAPEVLRELIVGDRLRRCPDVDVAAVRRDQQHEDGTAATH